MRKQETSGHTRDPVQGTLEYIHGSVYNQFSVTRPTGTFLDSGWKLENQEETHMDATWSCAERVTWENSVLKVSENLTLHLLLGKKTSPYRRFLIRLSSAERLLYTSRWMGCYYRSGNRIRTSAFNINVNLQRCPNRSSRKWIDTFWTITIQNPAALWNRSAKIKRSARSEKRMNQSSFFLSFHAGSRSGTERELIA